MMLSKRVGEAKKRGDSEGIRLAQKALEDYEQIIKSAEEVRLDCMRKELG